MIGDVLPRRRRPAPAQRDRISSAQFRDRLAALLRAVAATDEAQVAAALWSYGQKQHELAARELERAKLRGQVLAGHWTRAF